MPSHGRPLSVDFYARPTLIVAQDLVGAVLVHETAEGTVSGRIVEVEAYIGESDPGCHAAAGRTRRNAPLYGPPGFAYVYLNYGVHCLLNAVTEDDGHPAAVLIRAAEPIDGVALMQARRAGREAAVPAASALCRGPGNLSRAFGIGLDRNLTPLTQGPLTLRRGTPLAGRWTRRIGLSKGGDRYWRYAVPDHPAVSGMRTWNADARPRPWPLRP